MGFFNLESRAPLPTIARCGACGLYKSCKTPKFPVSGAGRKRILIVGEAPTRDEDQAGELLLGQAAKELEQALKACKISLRNDCWYTNAAICHPKKSFPSDEQVDHCRPNLIKAIADLEPLAIILLGPAAVRSLLSHTWKGDIGAITRWVGWKIPSREPNAWICPTFSIPSIIKAKDPVLFLMFKNHLQGAVDQAASGRPWDTIPDYKSKVEIIKSPEKAAAIIDKMTERGGLCAWDYETDRLKPDHPDASIVTASICWRGKRTIAFPWHGPVVKAMKRFLKSDVPKIAANMKFEHRWTKARLGVEVNNWVWDTVLSAHHLDNRQSITSIKFQAYVRLGWPLYDSHIEKFLDADRGNQPNKIRKLAIDSLLLYNGLDSLLEYEVAIDQMEEAGFRLF